MPLYSEHPKQFDGLCCELYNTQEGNGVAVGVATSPMCGRGWRKGFHAPCGRVKSCRRRKSFHRTPHNFVADAAFVRNSIDMTLASRAAEYQSVFVSGAGGCTVYDTPGVGGVR